LRGSKAKIFVELPIRPAAPHVLVEDRNPAPLLWVVQTIVPDAVELAPEERRALCLRQRVSLALGLNFADFVV
jgi:hypothetical protein